MFERYSSIARHTVVLAQEAARGFNHSYVGNEHLLAALLGTGSRGGRAGKALEHFGITSEYVKQAIIGEVGEGVRGTPGHIPFTPQVKEALVLANQEAIELRDADIDDTHLLLGLLGMEEGLALKIILSKVDSVSVVREALLKDMTITRALTDEKSGASALETGVRMHELLEQLVAAGGSVDAVDFTRGQADAARQILELIRGGRDRNFTLAG